MRNRRAQETAAERLDRTRRQMAPGDSRGVFRGAAPLTGRGRGAGDVTIITGNAGVDIHHVTLSAVADQTIADGGGTVQWGTLHEAPTEVRGFNTLLGELAADGSVGAIPIDVTGVMNWLVDGEWEEFVGCATMTVTLIRNGSAHGSPVEFDLGPVTSEFFGGDADGWEVRAGDFLQVDLANASGSDQILAAAKLVGKIIAPAGVTSDVPVPAPPGDYDEAVLADEPDAYFMLRETTSASAVDEQGGDPGTYAGSDHTRGGATTPDGFPALRVNADAGGWVQLGSRFTFEGTQPFTVSIMAKPSGGAQNALVASAVDYFALDDGWILRYHRASGPTTTLDAIRRTGGGEDLSRYTFTTDLGPEGQWMVAAIIYDGTDLWAYANGEQSTPVASSRSLPTPGRDNPTNINAVRSSSYNEVLEGDFARAAFWSRALTKAELDVHYAALGVVLST